MCDNSSDDISDEGLVECVGVSNTTTTTTITIGMNYKLFIYMTFSAVTLAECVLAGYLTLLSTDLRERLSTWFSSSLVFCIGVLSALSLAYVLVLLSSQVTYYTIGGCWVRMIQRYLSIVSCLFLVCLALDRYLAICWPLRYHNLLTRKLCRRLCIMCWSAPVFLLMVPCVRELPAMCHDGRTNKTFLISYGVAYTLGTLATLVLYLLVALEFREGCCHASSRDNTEAPSEDDVVRQRTAKSALTVLMLYTVLSLPHILLPILLRVIGRWLVPWYVADVAYLVHRLHLLLFLPMYAFTSSSFLASLEAWGRYLVHRASCKGAREVRRETPTVDFSITHHSIGDML